MALDSSAADTRQTPAADELRAWLQLLETPGLGRQGARRLLAAFGDPLAVLAAGPVGWRGVVEPAVVQALQHPPAELDALIKRTQQWLDQATDRHVLVLGDGWYPAALLESPDPPLLLYAIGQLRLLQRPALAIVGSRHPTAQGKETARSFAKALGATGLTVVSGLAAGIDAAAHEGALDDIDAVAGDGTTDPAGRRHRGAGSTIAVVGTGLDRIYPRGNRELALRIADHGLLLSEFSLGTPPLAQNFPQRNRIIAGLSLGTLVVEAALQSGSLITARLASEAGREVFAVPGSIHAPQSRGCHALIKQGAKLVEDMADILTELRLAQAPSWPAATPADEVDAAIGPLATPVQLPIDDSDDAVLNALGWSAATLDVLQVRTGLSVSDLVVRLLTLELEGCVARLPGELFQRVVRA
ncbi:MAG: DNA-protecting protein DprA [Burkholderiales bacterium]|nr:DNA-protecting protein DprA [Burkholderiales bacterium]